MAKRNKKVLKLRAYRDKLLVKVTNLESTIKSHMLVMHQIRKALAKEDHLRAYALASDEEGIWKKLKGNDLIDLTDELALAYRMLNVERRYSADIQVAALQRDYLRVAAISAEHQAESIAHDKMLSTWSIDHGYTRRLRDEDNEIIV